MKAADENRDNAFSPKAAQSGISDKDWDAFQRLTSVELSAEERAMASVPTRTDADAKEFLAVHWHPEWVPLELVETRISKAFPAAANTLSIPTQHNKVMCLGPWAGVEADVYDRAYGQKVQLLIHFRADRLHRAETFIKMMDRTYNYRAHQLLDILGRLAEPVETWAAISFPKNLTKNAAQLDAVQMARFYAIRLKTLIEMSGILGSDRDEMLKNRLLPDFIQARIKPKHAALLEPALLFIKAVKKSVKAELSPEAFYSPQEVIEEARSFGAGIVIPHPPLFWPILLSGLDVDGWEIWNPSTPDHAVFLAEALARANQPRKGKKLLAFMGDDTHMSAKIRPDSEKNSKEIGFQPPWQNQALANILKQTNQSRAGTINEYGDRLLGG